MWNFFIKLSIGLCMKRWLSVEPCPLGNTSCNWKQLREVGSFEKLKQTNCSGSLQLCNCFCGSRTPVRSLKTGRLWRSSSGRSRPLRSPRLPSPGRRPNPVRSGGLKPRRHGEKTKVKCWTTFLLTGDLLISRCWKERFSQSIFVSDKNLSVGSSFFTSLSPPSSLWMFSAINVFSFLLSFSRLLTRTWSDLWFVSLGLNEDSENMYSNKTMIYKNVWLSSVFEIPILWQHLNILWNKNTTFLGSCHYANYFMIIIHGAYANY